MMPDGDLENKLAGGKNVNTVKSDKKANKAFVNFLLASGCDLENLDN